MPLDPPTGGAESSVVMEFVDPTEVCQPHAIHNSQIDRKFGDTFHNDCYSPCIALAAQTIS